MAMFDNIGKKCKAVAKFLCYAGIICSVIAGLVLITIGLMSDKNENGLVLIGYGLGIAVVGSITSWLSSLGLYGIGEAAENSAIAANLAAKADIEREQEKKNA